MAKEKKYRKLTKDEKEGSEIGLKRLRVTDEKLNFQLMGLELELTLIDRKLMNRKEELKLMIDELKEQQKTLKLNLDKLKEHLTKGILLIE